MLTAADFLSIPKLRAKSSPGRKRIIADADTERARAFIRSKHPYGTTSLQIQSALGLTRKQAIRLVSDIRTELEVVGVRKGNVKLYVMAGEI